MKALNKEIVEEINKLHKQGLNTYEIASVLDIGQATVCRKLKANGVDFKQKHMQSMEKKWEIGEQMFLQGKSITQITKELKIGAKLFREWMIERGHDTSRDSHRYTCNQDYFKVIDSEDKAYWLGFLYADGCVSLIFNKRTGNLKSANVELTLASVDEEHLSKFRRDIESTHLIKKRIVNSFGKTFSSSRIVIYNTRFALHLIEKGCIPNKTNCLTFPSKDIVPNEFLLSFVRGYIDGDGSLGFSWSKRNNKYYPRVSLLGTREFIEGLLERTGWERKAIRGNSCKDDSCRAIEWTAKEEVVGILHSLYKNSTIHLERKYEKYKEIIAYLEGNL